MRQAHISKWSEKLFVFFVHNLMSSHRKCFSPKCARPSSDSGLSGLQKVPTALCLHSRHHLRLKPQERHHCTNGSSHWALQPKRGMMCLKLSRAAECSSVTLAELPTDLELQSFLCYEAKAPAVIFHKCANLT